MIDDQSLVPQNRVENLITDLNSKQANLSGSDSINISNNTLTAVGQIKYRYNSSRVYFIYN